MIGVTKETDFKVMTNDQLNNWIKLYENIPISRILMKRDNYINAIQEAYLRYQGDEVYRYCFFMYIDANGSYQDYLKWKNE